MSSKYDKYIHSYKWIKIRDSILDRDNHTCLKCWWTEKLNVHHWTYRRLYKESPSDLFTLCTYCHKTFHNTYWVKKDMLTLTRKFIWTYVKKEYEITDELIKFVKDWWNFRKQSLVPLRIWKKIKHSIRKWLL